MKARFYYSQPATIDPNSVIDDEALNFIRDLNAVERAKFAQKLAMWAEQCFQSAVLMNPRLGKTKPVPKVPKAFFLVNLPQWEKDEMRRMARECGVQLRSVFRWAVSDVREHLKEMHRITKLTGLSLIQSYPLREGNPKN
jgi:hypothetical protein